MSLIYWIFVVVAAFSTFENTLADQVQTNGYLIQLRIETTNSNILVNGFNGQVYTVIQTNEPIKITCTKIGCNENGTLSAYLNGNRAQKMGGCLSYASNSFLDYKCLSQSFQSTLQPDSPVHDIECRFEETGSNDAVKYTISKLFSDGVPRIRIGSNLERPGVISVNFLNKSVSCEVIGSQNDASFDSIQWFALDSNQNLNFNSAKVSISNNLLGYTVAFPTSGLLNNIQGYKCCTTKGGNLVRCQATYLIADYQQQSTNSVVNNPTNPFPCQPVDPCSTQPTTTTPCTNPGFNLPPCPTTQPCITTSTVIASTTSGLFNPCLFGPCEGQIFTTASPYVPPSQPVNPCPIPCFPQPTTSTSTTTNNPCGGCIPIITVPPTLPPSTTQVPCFPIFLCQPTTTQIHTTTASPSNPCLNPCTQPTTTKNPNPCLPNNPCIPTQTTSTQNPCFGNPCPQPTTKIPTTANPCLIPCFPTASTTTTTTSTNNPCFPCAFPLHTTTVVPVITTSTPGCIYPFTNCKNPVIQVQPTQANNYNQNPYYGSSNQQIFTKAPPLAEQTYAPYIPPQIYNSQQQQQQQQQQQPIRTAAPIQYQSSTKQPCVTCSSNMIAGGYWSIFILFLFNLFNYLLFLSSSN